MADITTLSIDVELAPCPRCAPLSRAGSPFVAGRFTGEKRNHDGLIQVDRWHDRTKGDSYNGLGKFNHQFWPATHWMPLPSAPGLTDNWPEGE